jgi:hypothetical protein
MNSQATLFDSPTEATTPQAKIVLEIKGIKIPFRVKGDPRLHYLTGIPSFKTGKTAFAWRDKSTGKLMARPLTLPHHKKWMEAAIRSIESQLRSTLQITDEKIRTVASPRSWIASLLPCDDSWTWLQEIQITSRLCREGEIEGATITIERVE